MRKGYFWRIDARFALAAFGVCPPAVNGMVGYIMAGPEREEPYLDDKGNFDDDAYDAASVRVMFRLDRESFGLAYRSLRQRCRKLGGVELIGQPGELEMPLPLPGEEAA